MKREYDKTVDCMLCRCKGEVISDPQVSPTPEPSNEPPPKRAKSHVSPVGNDFANSEFTRKIKQQILVQQRQG